MISVLHPITRLIVGGAQENTMLTAALLDKECFHAEIVSGPQTGSEGSLIEEVRDRGVPLTILPELVREVSPLNDFLAIWKLYRMMKKGNYTLVHTHSSKAGILGRLAARLAGVPVIVHTVHGWSFHDHMSPRVRKIYVFLEKVGAANCSKMIVVTRRDIDKGLREGIGSPDQYTLIRSAIPLDEFSPKKFNREAVRKELGLPVDAPVLGNVGRFSDQKNPLDWVRVAGKVGRALPESWFLLVGDGPLRPEVEALLQKEGVAGRTILTGLRRDAARMMSAMDVFLLTSMWEGLPRVIPQAMSMGLPVVATGIDGSSEAILPGETGYVCPPLDLEQLSQRCISLLKNEEIRRKMGERGRAFAAQEFDVNVMVAQIGALYRELLAKKGILVE